MCTRTAASERAAGRTCRQRGRVYLGWLRPSRSCRSCRQAHLFLVLSLPAGAPTPRPPPSISSTLPPWARLHFNLAPPHLMCVPCIYRQKSKAEVTHTAVWPLRFCWKGYIWQNSIDVYLFDRFATRQLIDLIFRYTYTYLPADLQVFRNLSIPLAYVVEPQLTQFDRACAKDTEAILPQHTG